MSLILLLTHAKIEHPGWKKEMFVNDAILDAIENYVLELEVSADIAAQVRRDISIAVASRQAGLHPVGLEDFFLQLQDSLNDLQFAQILEIILFSVASASVRSDSSGDSWLDLKSRISYVLKQNYFVENSDSVAGIIVEIGRTSDQQKRLLLRKRYSDIIKGSQLPLTYQHAVKSFIKFLIRFCEGVATAAPA